MASLLSVLDTERFGVRTAKTTISETRSVAEIFSDCGREQIRLLIARCDALDQSSCDALQARGAFLVDSLISYRLDLATFSLNGEARVEIKQASPSDAERLKVVAEEGFANYRGHYHNDIRLDRALCAGVYGDWIYRACLKNSGQQAILIAEDESRAALGFALVEQTDSETGVGALYAVSPQARGQGVYQSLLSSSVRWCQKRNLSQMIYKTQGTNFVAQTQVARIGFQPFKLEFTFHKWFD